MHAEENTNPNRIARIAGILYLAMVPLGFFGMFGHSNLVAPGDAPTTVSNIKASELLFHLSIVSALVVQIVNILLVLVLYKLLRPVNRNQALLMVVFFLVSAPITMLNEVNQFAVLKLLSGADYLTVFGKDQLNAQVLLFLDLHEHGIHISGMFWGLWLFPMGYLIVKSDFLPKILGVLLIIGGVGYLADSIRFFFFPSFGPIAMYTFWGELLLPLWLLIKGVSVEKWKQRTLEAVPS